jgi:hypothetical protein
MADFCRQCTELYLGIDGDKNDFVGETTPEDTAAYTFGVVLCEGCGSTLVDHTGACVAPNCLVDHETGKTRPPKKRRWVEE